MENNEQYEKDWGWVQDIKPGLKHLEERYFVDRIFLDYRVMYFYFETTFDRSLFYNKILPIIEFTYPDITVDTIGNLIEDFNFISLREYKNDKRHLLFVSYVRDTNSMVEKCNGDNYFGLNS